MLFSKTIVVAFTLALGAQAVAIPRAEAAEQDEALKISQPAEQDEAW